ncbi:MAG: Bacitracin transport permease protein [Parcubacteria group bacterium]|nr:Bacitracin transport permease protein [Parcubacteria group bacterium]
MRVVFVMFLSSVKGIVNIHMSLNQKVFDLIYGLSHHSAILDWIGIFCATYLQYILGIVLLILLFYPAREKITHRWMLGLSVLSALVSRYVVKGLIVLAYKEPRPFVNSSTVHSLVTTLKSEDLQSFPSGHTLFFFAIAMMIYLFDRRLGKWFFASAALIALARVYVGVHWPIDILAGAIIGTVTSWIIYALFRRFIRLS